MFDAQVSTTDSGKSKTLPTDITKQKKSSAKPSGTDASHTEESDHHEDPAAGLRAQVYAKPADRKADKKPDEGDNNPALAAVVAVGTILQIKNGSWRDQAVVQQELHGGKMLLLRNDRLKDAVAPYTPAPGETKLSQIPGTDLFMGHDNVVVRFNRDENTFERMFGYNLVLADQVTAQKEVTLPGTKDDQRVTAGKNERVQRPDGTEMQYPSNYDWGQKNTSSLPLYSDRYPHGSMKVIRGDNGEALLVDPAGTVLRPDEAGNLRVLPDVKVIKLGELPSAYKYLDVGTGKFNLPKDRIAGASNGIRFAQSAEGVQLIAYTNLAGASQEYTPKPGERLRPITIDGVTYYRSVEQGEVVERQRDGTYRSRPEFSLRLPWPSPREEKLTQSGDIVIPGGEPQPGPARPRREGSLAVQETAAGSADRSGLSSFDEMTMRDRIMDLRGQRARTRDETRELAALEMVRDQMEADPKARTEFAERLAKLRELGGLAGVAIIVTAALEFCASQNGKQNDAAIRAIVQ